MPIDPARHVDKALGTDGLFERGCEDARKARQSGRSDYFADVADTEQHAKALDD
ncbi:hypothetical protein [Streptomyces sp. S.PB5]|uniref:hypothetical protein n=1 Tax=Streptomyces sp. S.PB5 TaxID=3020844 RepID=UPI00339D32B0